FAQVVKAQKEGQAALERARGETAALRNLANAARTMEENPTLLQLRALQTLADSPGNTLVLGLPNGAVPVAKRHQHTTTAPTKDAEDQTAASARSRYVKSRSKHCRNPAQHF